MLFAIQIFCNNHRRRIRRQAPAYEMTAVITKATDIIRGRNLFVNFRIKVFMVRVKKIKGYGSTKYYLESQQWTSC